MDPLAAIVLAALLGRWCLDRLASGLDLRRLAAGPPAELASAFPPVAWLRTREYLTRRARLSAAASATDLLALLGFWTLDGFARLEAAISSLQLAPVPHGLLYVGSLLLARSLLGLPFEWWSTFHLEQRFGLNRTTVATFWSDRLRGLLLGALLGAPLLAGVLALLHAFGPGAWIPCWVLIAVLTLALQAVLPVWILPLFFRFDPLEEGPLRRRLLVLSERLGFPVAGVYRIDGSRRSTRANAFFTGFGPGRRIALFDTLIERHGVDEVEAVLAHEIGHQRLRHLWIGTIAGLLHTGLLLGLLSLLLGSTGLHAAFGLDHPTPHTALVLFGVLLPPVELLTSLALGALSRRHEHQADAFSARALGSGEPLARALVRLAGDGLAHPCPHPLSTWLHASHPPLAARVRMLLGAVRRGGPAAATPGA